MVDTDSQGEIVRGRVKWFDVGKGFGFIVAESDGPDILLHANVLRNFGQGSVAEGAGITVRTHSTPRGLQANEILEIVPPEIGDDEAAPSVDLPEAPADAPFVAARVKWFDKAKGFGFANIFGHPEDVFVHIEVLRRYGFADLQSGEAIAMKVVDGPRGQLAAEIRSWDYVV
ncbi:cold shock domain-containing protein [Maritalea mobilis]|uniref:cold-shock protein n=1 Tax=Maritalea mobilis TaxID=483324 RepID=UPI001C97456C|nr:cold shock domain-containing protein [Maritalea mobilis]MBY6200084.1 cold shock domain-containing protein [Maritalea mobilis]